MGLPLVAAAGAVGAGACFVLGYRRDRGDRGIASVRRPGSPRPRSGRSSAVRGSGKPMLVSHGIFQGCDGALLSCAPTMPEPCHRPLSVLAISDLLCLVPLPRRTRRRLRLGARPPAVGPGRCGGHLRWGTAALQLALRSPRPGGAPGDPLGKPAREHDGRCPALVGQIPQPGSADVDVRY